MLHFDSLGYKNWASEIRHILSVNGFWYVWENQGVQNEKAFMRIFEQRIKDQFLQIWKTQISSNSKLSFYAGVKFYHCLESYLDILKISKFRNALSSFRVSCHVLEIEKGRHMGVERENRKCPFCPQYLEDEYHFILICKKYDDLRRKYLQFKYFVPPNFHKFIILMSSKNKSVIRDVALYIYHAIVRRSTLL